MTKTYTKAEVAAMPLCTEQDIVDYYNTKLGALEAWAMQYSNSNEDRDDIIQDAFITMIKCVREERLRGEKGIEAGWRTTITQRGIDAKRKDARWRRNIQAGMDKGHEVSLTASPQAHLMHKEDTKVLSEVIPTLIAQESNERAQEVLTYVYLKGFSQIEAAEAAGMSYRHAKRLIEGFRKRVTMIAN